MSRIGKSSEIESDSARTVGIRERWVWEVKANKHWISSESDENILKLEHIVPFVFLLSPCNLPPHNSMRGCSAMSNSLTPWTVACQALLSMGFFLGKNTGVGCRFLLQEIFLTQGSNQCLLHWQVGFLPLSHVGSPIRQQSDIKMQVRSTLSPFTASSSSHPTWSRIQIPQEL